MFSLERERMTSAERMKALLTGQKPDRVPFIPFSYGFNTLIAGYEIGDYYADPKKSFRSQMLCKEILAHDGNPLFSYASFGAWEFGGKIRFPSSEWDQAPIVVERPVSSPEDVENLKVPPVEKAGYLPNEIEFLKLVAANGLPIFVKLGTPFTTAGSVVGETLMLRWMIKRPELVHKVLRKVTDFFINIAHYFVKEYGAGRIMAFDAGPTEASNLISPQQFEDFVLPYLLEIHEKIMDMGVARFLTHVCGEQNLNLVHWRKVPMGDGGVLSFGPEVDLKKAIEIFGNDTIVGGNIDTDILLTGTPEEVYEKTRDTILVGKTAPRGYILMPGCELPPRTPLANIYYMRKALNDHGFYE